MLKKTINYTDYNGVEQSDVFYFNLSKAELIEMQFSEKGGFENYLQHIIEADNNKAIFALFKDILLKSVGQRSEDGKRFIKNQEIADEFAQTEAFSELILELIGDDGAAADFMNGLVPANLAEEAKKTADQRKAEAAKKPQDRQKPKVALSELQGK